MALAPLLVALVASALTPTVVAQADGRPQVTVGFVLDGPQAETGDALLLHNLRELLELVRSETRALTRREFDVRFPESKIAVGDWTLPGIRGAFERLLEDPQVDVVVSLGPFATNELARRTELPKPVVAAWALDIQAQNLPYERDTSGVANLNYLVAQGSILRDLRKFREVSGVRRVHIVTDRRFLELIPEIPANVVQAGEALGLELIPVPADDDAAAILASLPEDTEGVYITPVARMVSAEFHRLVQGLIDRRLPSFSLLGEEEVERGVLAGVRARTELPRLARRIALNIQRILLGEDAGTLSVTLDQPERLVVNMETARAIGAYPSWRVLVEAVQLNREALLEGRLLTFEQAVLEAVESNLSLRATDRAVAAGEQNVALARSSFRPQAEVFARGVRIDADRAEASFGSQAERSAAAGLSVSQLVYSDAARANLSISKSLQQSLTWQREVERLDIALAAARAYLDVLRAETLERVERENLRLTESNLDLARRRERLGVAGPGDVYRWEAQLAVDRSDMIAAQNRTRSARVAVNRLLHRPLEEPFVTRAPGLEEPWLVTCCDRLDPYVDNPGRFSVFRDFVVNDGLSNSVELHAVDAAIAARERVLLAARRSFWSPDVALRGEADRDFARDGAGSVPPTFPPGFPFAAVSDRNDWSLALVASLPLFRGGARFAELRQAREELSALQAERYALAETIELRIRAALFETGSSFPAIELAQEAAEAAGKNLELVTDAYSRGLVSIIELLDAQNAALAAEEFAANAVFDFLLDLMEVQRASNSFDFFVSDAGRDAWFERLEGYFRGVGESVRPSER